MRGTLIYTWLKKHAKITQFKVRSKEAMIWTVRSVR